MVYVSSIAQVIKKNACLRLPGNKNIKCRRRLNIYCWAEKIIEIGFVDFRIKNIFLASKVPEKIIL